MHSKSQQLVDRLTRQTNSSAIQWQESFAPNSFELKLRQNTITITSSYVSVLGEMEPCRRISLIIEDLLGNEIEEIAAIDFTDGHDEMERDYQALIALYNLAYRSARNIDSVIDKILDELN